MSTDFFLMLPGISPALSDEPVDDFRANEWSCKAEDIETANRIWLATRYGPPSYTEPVQAFCDHPKCVKGKFPAETSYVVNFVPLFRGATYRLSVRCSLPQSFRLRNFAASQQTRYNI